MRRLRLAVQRYAGLMYLVSVICAYTALVIGDPVLLLVTGVWAGTSCLVWVVWG